MVVWRLEGPNEGAFEETRLGSARGARGRQWYPKTHSAGLLTRLGLAQIRKDGGDSLGDDGGAMDTSAEGGGAPGARTASLGRVDAREEPVSIPAQPDRHDSFFHEAPGDGGGRSPHGRQGTCSRSRPWSQQDRAAERQPHPAAGHRPLAAQLTRPTVSVATARSPPTAPRRFLPPSEARRTA